MPAVVTGAVINRDPLTIDSRSEVAFRQVSQLDKDALRRIILVDLLLQRYAVFCHGR